MINYCDGCGQGFDGSVGIFIELDDNGLCQECREMFCPICGQEHNADNEYNAGYCQHCKEPILDYSTGEFFDYLK